METADLKTKMKGNSGFTLLELMVGVAVAAVLLTIGLPSFSSSIKKNQGVTDANGLLALLTMARSEAIKRDQTVTLCASADGASCDSNASNWTEGYCMYVSASSSSTCSAATALRAAAPLATASSVSASSVYGTNISFNGLGSAGSVNSSNHFTASAGVFTVTPNNLPAGQKSLIRCVSVYQSGRIYVKNPNPTSLACT